MQGFTTYDNPTKSVLYTTGDGQYVVAVNVAGGASKRVATLPASYDSLVGLTVANGLADGAGAWFVVTHSQLLQIDRTAGNTELVMDLTGNCFLLLIQDSIVIDSFLVFVRSAAVCCRPRASVQ